MLQKLLINGIKWVEDISKFNEAFIKSYIDESDEGYFPEVDVQHPENLHNFQNELPFTLINWIYYTHKIFTASIRDMD